MAGPKGKGSLVAISLKSAGRQERLAAALRENLKRRKARAQAPADEPCSGLSQEDGVGPSAARETSSPHPKPARNPARSQA
jgi:hypothetical protein